MEILQDVLTAIVYILVYIELFCGHLSPLGRIFEALQWPKLAVGVEMCNGRVQCELLYPGVNV